MTGARQIGPTDVLLAVDVQNDFCSGGALAVPGGEDVVAPVNALLARFSNAVLTQDWHPAGHSSFASSHAGRRPYETVEAEYGQQVLWPDHCVRGTRGAAFHPALEVDRAQLILRKGFHPKIDSYSAFYENDRTTPTGLSAYLRERGLSRIVICGLATDFCVAWSALDARRHGFDVLIVTDACRAIDLDGSLAAAMGEMNEAGVQPVASHDLV
ncbi:bifunctional nicotinamidase/pyrazinamidase [Lutibaculum baratangense]|uniref:Nicotinamidase n=1 Tax=Lutibaculum baratangense AMV1 TaxID=631454 RepID=V4RNS0_9HYPH|nr:bifunctional nicotinamidase/pyrazinamidase [Lutibaculum baratangense]ESR26884.1 Nicotinamidase [Lutibaculum baratangense AMV1]